MLNAITCCVALGALRAEGVRELGSTVLPKTNYVYQIMQDITQITVGMTKTCANTQWARFVLVKWTVSNCSLQQTVPCTCRGSVYKVLYMFPLLI